MPRHLRLNASPIIVAVVQAAILSSTTAWVGPAMAQTGTATPPAKHKPDPYGSPLDTIMSTHLWTNVPQAQDFVRDTRPSAKELDYAPLTGEDPERPKPRDAANVMALQAELEQGIASNATRARGLAPEAKSRHARRHSSGGP